MRLTWIDKSGTMTEREAPTRSDRAATMSGTSLRASRPSGQQYVYSVSAEGVEVLFKATQGEKYFDATKNDQIMRFAENFVRSCSEKQDIPSGAPLIEMARRTQYRQSAYVAARAKTLKRRRKIAEGLAAISCVVLGYALVLGADRRLNEQKHIAVVASNSVNVDAPKTGKLVFVLPAGDVVKGDAVAGIRTDAGGEFVIEAPCDCQLAPALAKEGEPVFKDKPLLKFWQKGTREFVALRIPMEQALRLKSGTSVSLQTIASGAQRQFDVTGEAVVIQALPGNANRRSTGDVAVRIYPPSPLDLSAGEIVDARLRSQILQVSSSVAQAKDGL